MQYAYLGTVPVVSFTFELHSYIAIGLDFLLIKQIPKGQNVFAKFG